ncbi:hypothetical protein GOP47_0020073 [Adiantum capillus-veneris]|uniref:F-box domain-containing protein n=1 Tax=Adiantum capillus-veneris TaxID=13818 RepID=A0A9D4Z7N4_ADICA|nr:hypothetical protein GOP47_0020073 [Adiantum capillus-veneris]
MDSFPAELVGKILSRMVRARDIAVASVACRKWREAATSYIRKLSFDDLDWPKVIEKQDFAGVRELIIAETVMRTTCLKELAIRCEYGKKSKMHAGMLTACLLHVKHVLKSFTLTSPLMPNVNVFERLASDASILEHLEWHHAYIPRVNRFVNGFPSLVSLALDTVIDGLSAQHFVRILSLFPRLKHLSLKNLCVTEAPSKMELNICNLETLDIDCMMTEVSSVLVLHDNKLGRLCLYMKAMPSGRLHWRRKLEGNAESMQELRLVGVQVAEFTAGDCLGRLELDGVNIRVLEISKNNLQHLLIDESEIGQLKVENMDSLRVLELLNSADFENAWLRMYSKIICKAGLGLCRLTIQGSLPYKGLINLDAICYAFPCLQALTMDYPNIYIVESMVDPPCFEEMGNVVVNTVMLPENCVAFSEWIAELLQRCPNLRSVVIMLDVALTTEPFENYDFIGELTSLLIPIVNPYPHINVTFEFA